MVEILQNFVAFSEYMNFIKSFSDIIYKYVKVILHILQNKKGGRRSSKISLAIPILILEHNGQKSINFAASGFKFGFGFKLLS